jgi:Flp pilus assembly protein TadG
VLITPVLIALVFTVIQAALLWHARQVALAGAQEGDRLARAAGATDPANVRADTITYLRGLGADLLSTPQVSVASAAGYATVTVTGRAVSLIPGATLTVTGTSRGPLEQFTPDTADTANPPAGTG